MRAELKAVSCDDHDLSTLRLDGESSFYVTLRLRIGSQGNDAADDFEVYVCNPRWLQENAWEPRLGRFLLIVKVFDYEEIKRWLAEQVEKCQGNDWAGIALKLSRVFSWEFEDYQA